MRGQHMTMRSPGELAVLPRHFVPDAVAGLDVHTEAGCAAARLRMATNLARSLKADTLIRCCRAAGIRHVTTGHQAAHALAAATLPAPTSERGH
jgi:hypothetical protein